MTSDDSTPEHLRPMSWWMRQAAEILTERAEEAERRQRQGELVSDPQLLSSSRLVAREVVADWRKWGCH